MTPRALASCECPHPPKAGFASTKSAAKSYPTTRRPASNVTCGRAGRPPNVTDEGPGVKIDLPYGRHPISVEFGDRDVQIVEARPLPTPPSVATLIEAALAAPMTRDEPALPLSRDSNALAEP